MSATQGDGRGILQILGQLLLEPPPAPQGLHPDPEIDPAPDPAHWGQDRRDAWFSKDMDALRACVRHAGKDFRESILSELAEYHGETVEQAHRKCIDWVELSVAEWQAGDRSTPEGVRDFYNTTTSWRYDLAWYAYLQAMGYEFPQSIVIARFLRANGVTGKLLDFGSGIGFNGQVFDRLGYDVTIADVSKPLLEYAIWRNARHGADIRAIDLNVESLPEGEFDAITAFDVLVHVTDFDGTAASLHRALKPGGWLIANFDTRAQDDASAWHLYDDGFDLDHRLQKAGFLKRRLIEGHLGCYQSVDPNTASHALRTLWKSAKLPLRKAKAISRRVRLPSGSEVVEALRGG